MNDKTALETITGHPVSGLIANAVAVGATTLGTGLVIANAPWLAVIPGAISSIASARMEARLTESLETLREDLKALAADDLSEDQLAFVMDAVSAMFSTVEPKKLAALKDAAKKAALEPTSVKDHGALLARVLRNMSAVEIEFLVQNFGREVRVIEKDRDSDETTVWVKAVSDDSVAVSGLLSLGLLLPVSGSWEADRLVWSRTASKVLALVT